MARPLFTPEELAELAAADAEIEKEFLISNEEASLSRALDAEIKSSRKGERKKKVSEYQHKYYEANREKIAEKRRAYYKANRGKIAERGRLYYQAHREEICERTREYARKRRAAAV